MVWLAVAAASVPFGAEASGQTGTEISKEPLTRDAVFMASLTFAGLGLFGASLLANVYNINKPHPKPHRYAMFVTLTGSYAVVAIQVSLASFVCCNDIDGSLIWGFTTASFVGLVVAGAGFLYLILKPVP